MTKVLNRVILKHNDVVENFDGVGVDGGGDLLPAVGGKVKDKDSEEGYSHARDYQVHLDAKSGFCNFLLKMFVCCCSHRVE